MSALLEAVNTLNDRLDSAESVAKALDAAGGDQPPPWVYVFRDQIEAISKAAEALEIIAVGEHHASL